MYKLHKTERKRRNTLGQQNSPPKKKERHKTVYIFPSSTESVEDQYASLAIESVKKNYLVGNLKPFAVGKKIFQQLKQEVSELKQIQPQIKLNGNFEKTTSTQNKMKRLTQIFFTKRKNSRKAKSSMKNQKFIESGIWDDHEILMQDYRDEMKAEKLKRRKTIQNLNNSIINKFPQFVDNESLNVRKNKLLKFKKQIKVAKIWPKNQQNYGNLNERYNKILDLEKQDYGIYSRSANRALYCKIQSTKNLSEIETKIDSRQLEMERTFYRSYMGSYSERKRILQNSQASLRK